MAVTSLRAKRAALTGLVLVSGLALVASAPASPVQPVPSTVAPVTASATPGAPLPAADVRDEQAERLSRNGNTARPSLSATPVPKASQAAPKTPVPATPAPTSAAPSRTAPQSAAPTSTAPKSSAPESTAPTREAEPEPQPVSAAISGSRYTTVALKVRLAPDTASRYVTVLEAGRKVAVTQTVQSGFRRIVFNGRARWVSAQYLSRTKPTPESEEESSTTSSAGSSSDGSSSGGFSSGSCGAGSSIEGGITRATVRVLRAVCGRFPGVTSYGGYRADSDSAHSSGRAIDAMVGSQSLGRELAEYVRGNAGELGVSEVIFAQQIWTTQRSGEGWRPMSDRGSVSANHFDHVHITVG